MCTRRTKDLSMVFCCPTCRNTVCWRPCTEKSSEGVFCLKSPQEYLRRSKNPWAFLDVQWNTFLQWLTFNVWTFAKQCRVIPWYGYRTDLPKSLLQWTSLELGLYGFLKAGDPQREWNKKFNLVVVSQNLFQKDIKFWNDQLFSVQIELGGRGIFGCFLMPRFNQVDVYSPSSMTGRTRARTMSRMDGCIILMLVLLVIDNKSWRDLQVHGLVDSSFAKDPLDLGATFVRQQATPSWKTRRLCANSRLWSAFNREGHIACPPLSAEDRWTWAKTMITMNSWRMVASFGCLSCLQSANNFWLRNLHLHGLILWLTTFVRQQATPSWRARIARSWLQRVCVKAALNRNKTPRILRMKSSQRSWPTWHCSHQTGSLDIDAGDFEISSCLWILESLPRCFACLKLIKSKPRLGTWATEDFDFDMTYLDQEMLRWLADFFVQKFRWRKNMARGPTGLPWGFQPPISQVA